MRPVLTILLVFATVFGGFSQYRSPAPQKYSLPKKSWKRSLGRKAVIPPSGQMNIHAFIDTIGKKWLPQNGIPNAIKMRPAPDMYVGNNGRGQDIYRAQQDNMPILKPDSSFYSGMPAKEGSLTHW